MTKTSFVCQARCEISPNSAINANLIHEQPKFFPHCLLVYPCRLHTYLQWSYHWPVDFPLLKGLFYSNFAVFNQFSVLSILVYSGDPLFGRTAFSVCLYSASSGSRVSKSWWSESLSISPGPSLWPGKVANRTELSWLHYRTGQKLTKKKM